MSGCLGLFLLTAAGLKGHGLVSDPLSENSFLASPQLQIAVIELEIALGLWLISGVQQWLAWLSATAFFLVMSGVSFYLGTLGQESCGCFGRVVVSPWYTFGLDLAILVLLASCRPAWSGTGAGVASGQPVHPLIKTVLGAVVVLSLLAAGLLLFAESPVEALARLRGETIGVVPRVTDIGDGRQGEVRSFALRLTNHSRRPLRIVGGTTTCACMATGDLPITIPAGESHLISVQVKFTGSPGRFRHRFVLYTDDETHHWVVARFEGRVDQASAAAMK